MKANELMIGDWISYNGKHYQVIALQQRVGIVIDPIGCIYNDADPIPLTEEILKANGFEQHFEHYEKFGYCRYDNPHLFTIYFSFLFRKDFSYVHELQHALRLFGYGEIADNFKIK